MRDGLRELDGAGQLAGASSARRARAAAEWHVPWPAREPTVRERLVQLGQERVCALLGQLAGGDQRRPGWPWPRRGSPCSRRRSPCPGRAISCRESPLRSALSSSPWSCRGRSRRRRTGQRRARPWPRGDPSRLNAAPRSRHPSPSALSMAAFMRSADVLRSGRPRRRRRRWSPWSPPWRPAPARRPRRPAHRRRSSATGRSTWPRRPDRPRSCRWRCPSADGAAETALIRVPPTSAAAIRPPTMPRVLNVFIAGSSLDRRLLRPVGAEHRAGRSRTRQDRPHRS